MNTKEYNREYYKNNKERLKDKRNKRELERYYKNRDDEKVEEWKAVRRANASHPCYKIFNAAKHRAKKSGLEFTICLNDLVVPDLCPILMTPLTRDGSRWNSPSIDRVDNSKGYTPDNVRIISTFANTRKGSLTLDQIERLYLYSR